MYTIPPTTTGGYIRGGVARKSGIGGTWGLGKNVKSGVKTSRKTEGRNLLGNLIAKLLSGIAANKEGAYSAKQQTAATNAFASSFMDTAMITPKEGRSYIEHPGISDYEAGEILNWLNTTSWTGKTAGQVKQRGVDWVSASRDYWRGVVERSPHMVYPSGGTAAGISHIPPYLEAGGWVSSYSYIANNPEYAKTMLEERPDLFERTLNSLVDPVTGQLRYSGMDARTREVWQGAVDVMMDAIKAKERWGQYSSVLEASPRWARR